MGKGFEHEFEDESDEAIKSSTMRKHAIKNIDDLAELESISSDEIKDIIVGSVDEKKGEGK